MQLFGAICICGNLLGFGVIAPCSIAPRLQSLRLACRKCAWNLHCEEL